ncbi:Cro/C1-type helix-turn-helix DNA-binding protein [Motilibacter peucedani]|uniref:Cro/C1-type helix-turn-helix DNA-binding protein n=1 Tax=Motilibacter peucedani TaxID=598650 RepID=A0A420XV25_9ACTN|nr:helix-turn-helix transcriptional regulator [Motilibacter peucedani]RKS80581.1 Cro/C1-type helix-turn-helix DNA-binding protein [Motilibacter peucedani]
MTRRQVGYQWHLAELMARHGLRNTTDLAPLLAERGVELSASQVYRLVAQTPERVSLTLLAALCDIFGCPLDELVTTSATDSPAGRSRRAAGDGPVVDLAATVRPRRARVSPDGP